MSRDYESGFQLGLQTAVALLRAGCSVNDLAALLPVDPAHEYPADYADLLAELRAIMGPSSADVRQCPVFRISRGRQP